MDDIKEIKEIIESQTTETLKDLITIKRNYEDR